MLKQRCACGVADTYERLCDYCAYAWDDTRCPHDTYQNPCPECDVVPVPQLPVLLDTW